jgi:hypothetical protein
VVAICCKQSEQSNLVAIIDKKQQAVCHDNFYGISSALVKLYPNCCFMQLPERFLALEDFPIHFLNLAQSLPAQKF